jgi:pimeloyl-ACP methyl ester carboxylesterase
MNARSIALALYLAAGLATNCASAAVAAHPSDNVTHFRYRNVDGVRIFYREAGPPGAPVVLLLHGYPASSYMFRNVIPALADRYHVVAPDYPGFGLSAMPDHRVFPYTFAKYVSLMDSLLMQLRAQHYTMYLFDIGAPIGFRLALAHPERVDAMIVQNGNAYAEGFSAFWNPIKAYWTENTPERRAALNGVVTLATTKAQYLVGVRDPSRIDPDSWTHDQRLLDRPGNRDIQLDILHDYASNVQLYPKFHGFFRSRRPPALIIWGKNDAGFTTAGARAYLRDLPAAELHFFDSGHFLLEDRAGGVLPIIRKFLDRHIVSLAGPFLRVA